jgi:UDP-glucose 4-epimerase
MTFLKPASSLRVLITGGSGFIGSHVADQFVAHGWDVVILGRTPVMRHSSIRDVTCIQGRVGDRALLEQIFGMGIDGVVHLASSTVPGTSNTDKMFDVKSNLVESLELLECCVKYKVTKLVLASSGGTVYGIPRQLPIPEESPTNPICSYGIVKLAQEKYLDLYHRLHGLNYVALRISNPYGPRQDPNGVQGVISVFAAKMMQQKPISVWGSGGTVRDFVHVRDIARLFYLAMISSEQGIFNAGSGVGISINDLIAMMSIELGVIPNIIRLDSRKCDVPATVLSCRKAKQAFGWAPQITMEHGIREVGAWLSNGIIPVTQPQVVPQPAIIPAAAAIAQMA